jgi:hypothetical protein
MAAVNQAAGGAAFGKANWAGYLAPGFTTIVWLEACNFANSGVMTMFGNPGVTIQCGITGAVAA